MTPRSAARYRSAYYDLLRCTIGCVCVFYISTLFSGARGSFLRSRLRGTQGTRLYTTALVWVPGGLRGACSGRSKSRNLASKPRGRFSAGLEPSKAMETPHASCFAPTMLMTAFILVLHCCRSSLWQPRYNSSRTSTLCGPLRTMRVWSLHMRVCCVCAMIRVRGCRCVRVCVFVCWNPIFQKLFVFVFALLAAAAVSCRITASLKLSGSRLCGRHGTTVVAQRVCEDHLLTMRVLTSLRVCAVCCKIPVRSYRRVQVCAFFVRWNPT